MSRIFEVENQMILRVPEDIADRLNELFDNEDDDGAMIDITPCIVTNGEKEDITQFK